MAHLGKWGKDFQQRDIYLGLEGRLQVQSQKIGDLCSVDVSKRGLI